LALFAMALFAMVLFVPGAGGGPLSRRARGSPRRARAQPSSTRRRERIALG